MCNRFLCYVDPKTKRRERRHLTQDDRSVARTLSKQAYEASLRKLLRKRLLQLTALTRDFENDEIDHVYTQLHPSRKRLTKPLVPTWEQKVQQWRNKPYQGLAFREGDPFFLTNQEEKVRSKSEKILADKFHAMGVAYKYECPFYLSKQKALYPDFTFLNPVTRRERCWEHSGMMGNAEYANLAIQKISTYARHGIYIGDRLIVTFESASYPLDDRLADYYIREELCRPVSHGSGRTNG